MLLNGNGNTSSFHQSVYACKAAAAVPADGLKLYGRVGLTLGAVHHEHRDLAAVQSRELCRHADRLAAAVIQVGIAVKDGQEDAIKRDWLAALRFSSLSGLGHSSHQCSPPWHCCGGCAVVYSLQE